MAAADRRAYLSDLVAQLRLQWPQNRTINIVCHGHSVPSGYFGTPVVDTFNAYPHLLHRGVKERFPGAVVNVIVTAIGGETSPQGAARFEAQVLCHRPDVLTIDYGLNDRRAGLPQAGAAWRAMIRPCLERNIKVLLLTPTHDVWQRQPQAPECIALKEHAAQIRALAAEFQVGLVDSFALFEDYVREGGDLSDLLSWPNHPNARGHGLVAEELLRWFAAGFL